jgi:hypothetical protein
MTTQQLQARHEKGERILDMIKRAELSLDSQTKSLKWYKQHFQNWITPIPNYENRLDVTTRALSRLISYYYSTMDIVPTESIEEIAKEVARCTGIIIHSIIHNDESTYRNETYENDEYRLDWQFTTHYFKGELEEFSDIKIAELYHNRRKYTAEEIDGLKLLLLEELTRKGKG